MSGASHILQRAARQPYLRLFHQDHLTGAAVLTGIHLVEVHTAGDAGAVVIGSVPNDAVVTGSFLIVDQGLDQLSASIVDVDGDRAVCGETVDDGSFRIEGDRTVTSKVSHDSRYGRVVVVNASHHFNVIDEEDEGIVGQTLNTNADLLSGIGSQIKLLIDKRIIGLSNRIEGRNPVDGSKHNSIIEGHPEEAIGRAGRLKRNQPSRRKAK